MTTLFIHFPFPHHNLFFYQPMLRHFARTDRLLSRVCWQWRNRRVGGRVPPRDFWPGNFCWRVGKKGKGKREKGWKLRIKEGKLWKGKWKIGNGSRKSSKKWWGPFFFSSSFFYFSLLKTMEICFGCTNMGIFYREKNHAGGKKSGKRTLPLRNICLLRPCLLVIHYQIGLLPLRTRR